MVISHVAYGFYDAAIYRATKQIIYCVEYRVDSGRHGRQEVPVPRKPLNRALLLGMILEAVFRSITTLPAK